MNIDDFLTLFDAAEAAELDIGESWYFHGLMLEFYADGSGCIVMTLHRKDAHWPAEKLMNMIGMDSIQKRIPCETFEEICNALHKISVGDVQDIILKTN
jgi:hypothetical protein